jgi:hypothetical protein
MLVKQVQLEQSQLAAAQANRALELIGRAIRMAGYSNVRTLDAKKSKNSKQDLLEIQKGVGLNRSDTIFIKHEISDGIDFDCIGNTLTKDRTKNHLAHQGFLLERQAGVPKAARINGGSLMCQSLDRQGRLQNTTLMNGVYYLAIEGVAPSPQKLFKVTIQMDLGKSTSEFTRTFARRNF